MNTIKRTDVCYIPSLIIGGEYAVLEPNSLNIKLGLESKNVTTALAGHTIMQILSVDYANVFSVISGKLSNTEYNINKAIQWSEQSLSSFGLDVYLPSVKGDLSLSITSAVWTSDVVLAATTEGTFDFEIKGSRVKLSSFNI